MDLRFIYALIFTILPITELRVGLPLAITYARDNGIPVLLVFISIILVNILVIFFVFYFLDNLHRIFLRFKPYKKAFGIYLNGFRKRVDKFERRYNEVGFLALTLFVAVPLPGTGAWTGCLASWLLGLDRRKSVLSIAIGVIIAGTIILLGTLGIIELLF